MYVCKQATPISQLGKLCFDRADYGRLTKILKQLHLSCQTEQGEDDMKKGTQLLEVYALEIQMYTEQKNNQKLKALYEQSLHIKSAIPHPLIMGVIRGQWEGSSEVSGRGHQRSVQWEESSERSVGRAQWGGVIRGQWGGVIRGQWEGAIRGQWEGLSEVSGRGYQRSVGRGHQRSVGRGHQRSVGRGHQRSVGRGRQWEGVIRGHWVLSRGH